jgi:hypothetical protein
MAKSNTFIIASCHDFARGTLSGAALKKQHFNSNLRLWAVKPLGAGRPASFY